MTVEGIVSGGVFCHDMGDVVVKQCTDAVQVVLTILDSSGAERNSLTETYYPDEGGMITIRELSALMEPYLTGDRLTELYAPHSGNQALDTSATLNVRIIQEEEELANVSQIFYRANSRTSILPSSYRRFLSRHSLRMAYVDLPLLFAHFQRGQTLTAHVTYWQTDGRSAYKAVPVDSSNAASGEVCFHTVLPSWIATQCGTLASNLIQVSFELKEGGNSIDVMTFEFDHGHLHERTVVLFKNLFGIPETLVLTGQNKRQTELDASYAWIKEKYRKASTALTTRHTVCTGWIDKTGLESLKDVVMSEEIYLLAAGEVGEAITVTGIDLEHTTPRTSPLCAYITYRVSQKVQERFMRDAAKGIPMHVVDDMVHETFDDTFEEIFA